MKAHKAMCGFSVGALLVALAGLSSCQVRHAISVRSDGSALVSTSAKWDGSWRGLYAVPYIREIDTSGIHGWMGGAVFIIDNVDSLGKHLSYFGPDQLQFTLGKDQLSIKADPQVAMHDGWSVSHIALSFERGIAQVRSYQKTRPLEHQVSLRVSHRQLRKHPDTVDFTIRLKPPAQR